MGAQAEMKRGRVGWTAAALALLALALPPAATAAPPPNDDFANAIAIGSGTVFGTTQGAVDGAVWYAWAAPDATPIAISTCSRSGPWGGETLAVLAGPDADSLETVDTTWGYCNGTRGGLLDLHPEPGRTYYIRVDGGSDPGGFRLRVGPRIPPDTTITSGIPEGGTTDDWLPLFTFASTDPEAGFQCSVDGREFGWCQATQHLTIGLAPLSPGPHRLEVRAKSLDGTEDPTPAVRRFTVLERPVPPNPFAELARQQCEEAMKREHALEVRVRKAERRLRRARGPIARWKAKSRLMHARQALTDFTEEAERSCSGVITVVTFRGRSG